MPPIVCTYAIQNPTLIYSYPDIQFILYLCVFELKSSESQVKTEDMQGDHIMPWCQGGRTVDDNLQMLCLPDLQS